MRAVLALASILLALTLALNHAKGLTGTKAGPALADRALEIVVGAKGPLLPAARIGSGPERIGEALRLGDRTLVGTGRPGLRAALLGPDFALLAEECFDVAHAEGARALRAAVEAARDGEILVLASSGRLAPAEGAEPPAELEQALTRLKARARPGSATPESWALIALRLERAWIPLAEGYSTDSGVALAFVLAPELERYADFQGDFARVRAPARSEVALEDELQYASARTQGVQCVRERSVQGQPLVAILMPPEEQGEGVVRPGRLVWSDVEIGQSSALFSLLGLADGADTDSDGATCEVRIDGELAGSRLVQGGARWRRLLVDLRRFAGRRVTLELTVDPGATATGDAVLWGRPTLVHGYEPSPLQR